MMRLRGMYERLARLPPETLILAWPSAVIAWRQNLAVEVFSLSEDDFARTLDAWAVAHGTPFPTDIWPPGPAWLAGALMRLGVGLEAAPTAVNLASITLALVLASDIARRLGVSAPLRLLAVAGVALLHWPAWLGLSGLAEPPAALAFVALAHGAVRLSGARPGLPGDEAAIPGGARASGLDARGARTQICAAAALAALCRYESWVLPLFAAGLLWMHRPDRRVPGMLVALAPFAVPLAWVALQIVWNGNLQFATESRDKLLTSHWRPEGVKYYTGLFTDVVEACGPLLPLGLVGGWLYRRQGAVRSLLILWLGTAICFLAAGILGFGGTHNTPRLWLGHVLLLPVGIALGLRDMAVRPILGGALLLGLATVCLPGWGPAPSGYDADTAAVGFATRKALAAMPGSNVVVEVVPWECMAMKGLIGEPGRVIWDRDPTGEPLSRTHTSLLNGSAGDTLALLAARHAQFVVTASPGTAGGMAPLGQVLVQSGEWTLWEIPSGEETDQGRILRELRRTTDQGRILRDLGRTQEPLR